MKRVLQVTLQVIILILCLWYLGHDLDFNTFSAGLQTLPLAGVAGLIGLVVLDFFAMGLRLKNLVGKVAYSTAVGIEILGNGLNVLLPAKLGEVFKIAALSKKAKISAAASTNFVFWSRFSELNILFFIVLCTLNQSAIAFSLAMFAIWLGLFALWFKPGIVLYLVEKVQFPKIRYFLEELIRNLTQRPNFLPRLLICSALVWLFYWLQYYWGLTWFVNTPLSLTQINLVFLAAAGVSAIPSTPGALGPYEAALVLVLTSFGVSKEEALLFSLCMRVFLYIFTALVAVGIALRWRMSTKDAQMAKETGVGSA